MKRYRGSYQIASGAYGKELWIGNGYVKLGAGNSDDVSLFDDGENIAVLSINSRLGYAGLQLLSKDDFSEVANVFFQSEDNFADMELKKDFFEYSNNRQADILSQYCY